MKKVSRCSQISWPVRRSRVLHQALWLVQASHFLQCLYLHLNQLHYCHSGNSLCVWKLSRKEDFVLLSCSPRHLDSFLNWACLDKPAISRILSITGCTKYRHGQATTITCNTWEATLWKFKYTARVADISNDETWQLWWARTRINPAPALTQQLYQVKPERIHKFHSQPQLFYF